MYVHGFQSKDGSEVRVYTLELVSDRTLDPDLEIPVFTPHYLVLAIVTTRRHAHGLQYIRGTVTYDVKKAFEMSTHTHLGLFTDEEASCIHEWVRKKGKELVSWMRRCPVTPVRGRTYSTSVEDA